MLPYLIVIMGALTAAAADAPAPFWKAKEKVYSRIKDGEVIVSVKSLENKGPPRNHLRIEGGGHVSAPASFVFKQALEFDQLAKVSGYIKSVKYDADSRQLELEISAFGYHSRLKLQLKIDKEASPPRIDFLVMNGGMQGLTGQFTFLSLAPKKCEVGIMGDFRYDDFRLPKLFLEFGLEVVFQRMAMRLRQHVEDLYKKEVGR